MTRRRLIRLLSLILVILLLIYITVVAIRFRDTRQESPCKELLITISSGNDKQFITEADIVARLKQAQIYPVGQKLNLVNTDKIEHEVRKNLLVSEVEAYKTSSGVIKLKITEKIPLLRIMTQSEDYYVDTKGSTMPSGLQYAVYVPIASGYIEKTYAISELYEFALFLQRNNFWNNQIAQIHIHPGRQVELIPRVGAHRIMLGTFEDYREKLDNLHLFYEQAIPKVGWSKYKVINLKYKNQIVCTKK